MLNIKPIPEDFIREEYYSKGDIMKLFKISTEAFLRLMDRYQIEVYSDEQKTTFNINKFYVKYPQIDELHLPLKDEYPTDKR